MAATENVSLAEVCPIKNVNRWLVCGKSNGRLCFLKKPENDFGIPSSKMHFNSQENFKLYTASLITSEC
jgi:hypothetical protein